MREKESGFVEIGSNGNAAQVGSISCWGTLGFAVCIGSKVEVFPEIVYGRFVPERCHCTHFQWSTSSKTQFFITPVPTHASHAGHSTGPAAHHQILYEPKLLRKTPIAFVDRNKGIIPLATIGIQVDRRIVERAIESRVLATKHVESL